MKILFSFPSRSRPTKMFGCLDNIRKLSKSDNYKVVLKLDLDDPDTNCDWVKMLLNSYPEVTVEWGYSKSKIHAVNRSLENHLEGVSIILSHSDDFLFLVDGFDDIIRHAFIKHFPRLDGAIFFPDSHAKSRTCTYSMLGINLYKQEGSIYNEEYDSLYADNEFTEKMRMLGKIKFIDQQILDHFHPIWKMAAWDNLYRESESPEKYKKDKETYLKRKAINFGI